MIQEKLHANGLDGITSMACGTLLSISGTLNGGDLIKGCVLAAVGTATSYIVSQVMKRVFK